MSKADEVESRFVQEYIIGGKFYSLFLGLFFGLSLFKFEHAMGFPLLSQMEIISTLVGIVLIAIMYYLGAAFNQLTFSIAARERGVTFLISRRFTVAGYLLFFPAGIPDIIMSYINPSESLTVAMLMNIYKNKGQGMPDMSGLMKGLMSDAMFSIPSMMMSLFSFVYTIWALIMILRIMKKICGASYWRIGLAQMAALLIFMTPIFILLVIILCFVIL